MVKIVLLSLIIFCANTEPVYTYNVEQSIETKSGTQDRAKRAFDNLIINPETKSEFIPSQTQVLSVQWDGRKLVVDVSKEIGSYGGGNAIEYEIMCQILNRAFSIPEVESFTLLIEGKEEWLPEGTLILDYTRDRYMRNVTRY